MQTGSEKLSTVIEKLGAAVSQLSVLRGAGGDVIPALLGLIAAADAGDGRTAALRSGELTSALLSCGARRVSGDLMTDFVLDTILMSRNPFAEAASAGRMDEAVFRAMRRDLSAMRMLSEIDEDVVNRLIAECGEQKRTDPAVKLATAAWGGAPAPAGQPREQLPKFRYEPPEKCWNYGEFELRDAYCADAALESMYRRFLEADDWTQLASELWSFHSSYGCGDFLRYRNFCLGPDGKLRPLPDLRPGDFVQLAEGEYRTLLNNAIAFLRDESAKPMLLYGANGMGKTTLMLELTDERPQLRLVYVPPTAKADLPVVFDSLRRQPLKFMTLFDDLNPSALAGICEPMLPMNVLVAACAPAPVLRSLFEVAVELPRLQLGDFIRIVMKLLEADGADLPEGTVRSACVDYQVDTRCEFNIAAAVRVKELLQS
jgi:predicted AAA+ superfamily ATPase